MNAQKNNVLTTVDLDHRAIFDVGVNNIIRTNIGKAVDFHSHQIPYKMNGNQDDFLLYADKNKDYTFTMIQGRVPDSGALINMFRADSTVARWNTPASEERFIFEIDFGKVISLELIGINFGYIPKYVKLDFYNTTNTWVTVREITDNQGNLVKFVSDYGNSAHINMSKIRITMGDPLKNLADIISIMRIFGYSNQLGNAYLPVGGGRVHGIARFDSIGVGNSDTVPPVGGMKGKFRVFDENGSPIGYVPLY